MLKKIRSNLSKNRKGCFEGVEKSKRIIRILLNYLIVNLLSTYNVIQLVVRKARIKKYLYFT